MTVRTRKLERLTEAEQDPCSPLSRPPACTDDCGSGGTPEERGCDDCDMREPPAEGEDVEELGRIAHRAICGDAIHIGSFRRSYRDCHQAIVAALCELSADRGVEMSELREKLAAVEGEALARGEAIDNEYEVGRVWKDRAEKANRERDAAEKRIKHMDRLYMDARRERDEEREAMRREMEIGEDRNRTIQVLRAEVERLKAENEKLWAPPSWFTEFVLACEEHEDPDRSEEWWVPFYNQVSAALTPRRT